MHMSRRFGCVLVVSAAAAGAAACVELDETIGASVAHSTCAGPCGGEATPTHQEYEYREHHVDCDLQLVCDPADDGECELPAACSDAVIAWRLPPDDPPEEPADPLQQVIDIGLRQYPGKGTERIHLVAVINRSRAAARPIAGPVSEKNGRTTIREEYRASNAVDPGRIGIAWGRTDVGMHVQNDRWQVIGIDAGTDAQLPARHSHRRTITLPDGRQGTFQVIVIGDWPRPKGGDDD